MAKDKSTHYIIWKDENGEEQRKDYSAAGGRNYWKEKIIKTLGESAVIEEGKEILVEEGGKQVSKKILENQREELLGPVDMALSIFGMEPTKRRFVMSNWNPFSKSYTSRLYGGMNDLFKVIEPDGYISLHGHKSKVIKHLDKETGIRTLTDGRQFTGQGWPIPDDLGEFLEDEEEVEQPVKKKTRTKKATSTKPKAKKAPAKRKTSTKKS